MRNVFFIFLLVLLISCKESPESIIEKNIKVRGGKTEFDKVKNVFMIVNIKTMGMELPVKFYIIRPSTMRTEVEFAGQKLVTLLLPDTIFAIVDDNITPLPPDAKIEMQKNLENQLNYFRSELMNFTQQGGKLVSVTKEKYKGKDAHKFKISYPDGTNSFVFIDQNSYLNIGTKTQKILNGEKVETESVYSDYRKISGFLVPYKTEVFSGKNLLASIQIDTIAINGKLDQKLFKLN
ncbi:MAG: hypothetical protein N2560_04550 [Ignavibacteria bacterium]|nr:hypothetical protein [Ignavibacteria bacterium]